MIIDALKSKELIQTAEENVQINENIYEKVRDLFDSGLTTDSEVKKIQATLSLARSNLTVQVIILVISSLNLEEFLVVFQM